MKLRSYQKKDYTELNQLLKIHDHVLFGGTMGFGKSVIILKIVKKYLKKGKRVLVIAPRRTLVNQLSNTCRDHTHSIVMGSDTSIEPNSDLIIASTASIVNRLDIIGDIDLVLIDEAHQNHSGKTMKTLRDRYWDSSKWVAFTGTPIDEKGYRLEGYEHTLYNHQTQDLIDLGYLTPVTVYVKKSPKGLNTLSITNGDYNVKELGDLMSKGNLITRLHKVYKKYNKEKVPTLIFAVNISHGELILSEFQAKGVSSAIVHSKMKKDVLEDTLRRFKNGEIKVLVNIAMLVMGYDHPALGCIIMARPTQSLRLYLQSCNRNTRIFEGKKEALFLDCAGVVDNLGHPTKHRNFNRIKPPDQKAETLMEHKDLECPFCKKEFQRFECPATFENTKKYEKTTLFCPHCNEVVDEVVVEYTKAQKMVLWVEKDKMTDAKMKSFLEEVRHHMGYSSGWIYYKMKEFRKQRQRYLQYYYKVKEEDVKIETIAGYMLKGK